MPCGWLKAKARSPGGAGFERWVTAGFERSAREHEINVYLKQDKLNYWELGALVSTFSGCDPVVGAQLFR